MRSVRTALSLCVLVLAACSESTKPELEGTILTDAAFGGTLTLAGASGVGMAGVAGLSGAVLDNPFALVVAPGQAPPPPRCTTEVPVVCTSSVNGITITFTRGGQDSLGMRSDRTMTGTIATTGTPALRIKRQGTVWTQPLAGASQTVVATRYRSVENGTGEHGITPLLVTTDTGSADLRVVFNSGTSPDARIPRVVGSSRRVIWTSRGGAPASFRREIILYDSMTVIRREIETSAGTQRCLIDLAATVIVWTCQ
jgi:hypothetical protein